MSIPKIIAKLLAQHNLTNCNSFCVPYVSSADLANRRPAEELCDKAAFQSAVGTFRFVADTTLPAISCITGVLGRHLHNPAPRHVAALKPILRFLSSRADNRQKYTPHGPLRLSCYTDSDYADDPDTRRWVTGIIALASDQPLAWVSVRQHNVSHSSTEAEFIGFDFSPG